MTKRFVAWVVVDDKGIVTRNGAYPWLMSRREAWELADESTDEALDGHPGYRSRKQHFVAKKAVITL